MKDAITLYEPPLQRITAKVMPTPLPWEVLTAEDARRIAKNTINVLTFEDWAYLRAYADAVDAMGQPPQIEWSE